MGTHDETSDDRGHFHSFLARGMPHLDRLAQPKPPPEAIDACRVLDAGAACTVNRSGEKTGGVCRTIPGEVRRFCVPNNMSAAQDGGNISGPPVRRHTIIQSSGDPVVRAATIPPIADSRAQIQLFGKCRKLFMNGIAAHDTGPFPNQGNPNRISEQNYSFYLPAMPVQSGKITQLGLGKFGIGLNGVPFDPGAAEFYQGNPRNGWQYEALSGAIDLGFDESHAHVQFTGAYHYHGLPTLFLARMSVEGEQHSPLIGWAADGFPIYAIFGWRGDHAGTPNVTKMTSSYRLKKGNRPDGRDNPGGSYDGTFVNDYEFVEGVGALDECNGRLGKTPEFPGGTYAYFLTEMWPTIPRCFKGTPSAEFIIPALPPRGKLPR